MKIILLTLIIGFYSLSNSFATPKKFLFDANKAQTAGNADWVIDEDNHTAGRFPTPDQSGIIQTTPESYWTGALSAWAVALVKLGNYVETLPNSGQITYNNTTNPQDLTNYDVFIIDEPNTAFNSTEKSAIIQFVQNGGGLMLISDHAGADRNNDGWDAIRVLNDLIRNNGIQSYPFGFIFDSLTVSDVTNNVLSPAQSDPVISGSQGNVISFQISSGTTLTINSSQNPNAKGLIWKTGSPQNNSNCFCVSSVFGTGRIVAEGDSSPADDSTGSSGHTLYPGWTENGGNSSRFHLNASLWLAKLSGVSGVVSNNDPVSFYLEQNYPNPFNPRTLIRYSLSLRSNVTLKVYDIMGKEVSTLVKERQNPGSYSVDFDAANFSNGVYYYKLSADGFTATKKMFLIK